MEYEIKIHNMTNLEKIQSAQAALVTQVAKMLEGQLPFELVSDDDILGDREELNSMPGLYLGDSTATLYAPTCLSLSLNGDTVKVSCSAQFSDDEEPAEEIVSLKDLPIELLARIADMIERYQKSLLEGSDGWVCTDIDTNQYRRKVGERAWEFKEDRFDETYSEVIDLTSITLADAMDDCASFGYHRDDVRDWWVDGENLEIIAECIFELSN